MPDNPNFYFESQLQCLIMTAFPLSQFSEIWDWIIPNGNPGQWSQSNVNRMEAFCVNKSIASRGSERQRPEAAGNYHAN